MKLEEAPKGVPPLEIPLEPIEMLVRKAGHAVRELMEIGETRKIIEPRGKRSRALPRVLEATVVHKEELETIREQLMRHAGLQTEAIAYSDILKRETYADALNYLSSRTGTVIAATDEGERAFAEAQKVQRGIDTDYQR